MVKMAIENWQIWETRTLQEYENKRLSLCSIRFGMRAKLVLLCRYGRIQQSRFDMIPSVYGSDSNTSNEIFKSARNTITCGYYKIIVNLRGQG